MARGGEAAARVKQNRQSRMKAVCRKAGIGHSEKLHRKRDNENGKDRIVFKPEGGRR